MEDLPVSDGSVAPSPMPEAGHDPGDPLAPEVEEEHSTPNPPSAIPDADMEVTGENEMDKDDADDFNDNESDLSEVDEAQFDDFDPAALALDEREQIAIDDSNVALLGVHKRKRTEAEIEESRKKKRREKKRDKPKKSRRGRRDGSEEFSGGDQLDGKRSRKRKEDGEGRPKARSRVEDDIDESTLTPAERTFSSRVTVGMPCTDWRQGRVEHLKKPWTMPCATRTSASVGRMASWVQPTLN
jgi:transcription factor SPN1